MKNQSALYFASGLVGQRETAGKNRSKIIDTINRFVKIPLGSPYCAAGICFCFMNAQKSGVPGKEFFRTGSSQGLRRSLQKIGAFSRDAQDMKDWKGAIFGWTNLDGVHGHVGFVSRRLTNSAGEIVAIDTIEFNSNAEGSRDGEGVVINRRTIPVDRGHKLWFLDVSQFSGGDFGWKVLP